MGCSDTLISIDGNTTPLVCKQCLTESDLSGITLTFEQTMNAVEIINNTNNDLTFTIGTFTYTIRGYDTFPPHNFADFTTMTISGTSPAFNVIGLGE